MIRHLALKPDATKEQASAFEAYAESVGIWVATSLKDGRYTFTLQFEDETDLRAFLCANNIRKFSSYEVE